MIEQDSRQKNSDEIDLLDFFNSILVVVKKMAWMLMEYLRVLWKGKWLFVFVLILFAGIGYLFWFFVPKSYKTEAVFISHGLDAKACSLLINNLNGVNDNARNSNILQSQLKVSPDIAYSIKNLSASPLFDTISMHFTDSTASVFSVELKVATDKKIAEIQDAIAGYLENNEYALKRKEDRLHTLKAINADYLTKIVGLDSLKTALNNMMTNKTGSQLVVLGKSLDPVGVYELQSNYYKEILFNNEIMGVKNSIEVLQPFLVPDTYNSPNFKKIILVSIAVGLVLALLFVPFWVKRK